MYTAHWLHVSTILTLFLLWSRGQSEIFVSTLALAFLGWPVDHSHHHHRECFTIRDNNKTYNIMSSSLYGGNFEINHGPEHLVTLALTLVAIGDEVWIEAIMMIPRYPSCCPLIYEGDYDIQRATYPYVAHYM